MSATLYVSCRKSALPTREKWQQAIDAAGFDVQLSEFEWRSQQGSLPVKARRRKTAFELWVEDAAPVAKQLGMTLPAGDDIVVSFVFGPEDEEAYAATGASAAFAACVNGSYFDEYSRDLLDGPTAISIAHDSLEDS